MRTLALIAVLVVLACEASQSQKPIVTEVSPQEFMSHRSGDFLILDVRTSQEYAAGHVESALNIPHDGLADRLAEIQKYAATPVLVYCQSGKRAGLAAETLAQAGFNDLHHLTGDMRAWNEAGLPVVKDGP